MAVTAVVRRAGRARVGCVFILLLLGVAGYAALRVGEIYYRAYVFEDRIKQQTRFASQLSDSSIMAHLSRAVDSLGLPAQARRVTISRTRQSVVISADYSELLDLHVWRRVIRFRPKAESSL